MKVQDVQDAVDWVNNSQAAPQFASEENICMALDQLLPVIERLSNTTGRFWIRWGVNTLLMALKEYQRLTCE